MKYRTRLQITAELLNITKDSGRTGIKTTNLIQKTNMAHNRLRTLLHNLTNIGLVNEIKFDGRNTFVITQKGMIFLDEYSRFNELANSFGLEL